MSNGETPSSAGLEWKWVILAVIAGLVIVGASYFIVAPTFHSAEIQALVMLVGFAVTGVIVGYFSPGVTIKEAVTGGALVMVLMLGILYATDAGIFHSPMNNFLLLLLGTGFSWVGGWAGEKLQGDNDPAHSAAGFGIQWKWVVTGVIIGFALNVLFVFLLAPVFKINLDVALVAFLVSFIVTGFIVGYKSPGVTLKEPAIAGLLAVLFDWLFLKFGIKLHVPLDSLVAGLAMGFMFALLGAWLGEKYQQSMEKKSRGS